MKMNRFNDFLVMAESCGSSYWSLGPDFAVRLIGTDAFVAVMRMAGGQTEQLGTARDFESAARICWDKR